MTDEEVWIGVQQIREQVADAPLKEIFHDMALDDKRLDNEDVTPGQLQAAYYRHKKIVELADRNMQVSIDSEAPVSDPKPLRDGTEGDSIAEKLLSARRMVTDLSILLYDLEQDLQELETEAAGTKQMSRLSQILGMDK